VPFTRRGVTLAGLRRPRPGTATTATELTRRTLLADFCNRRETRAHPPVNRHPARPCGCPRGRCLSRGVQVLERGRSPHPRSRAGRPSACMAARRPRANRSRAPVVANPLLPTGVEAPVARGDRRGCRRPPARTVERTVEPGCLPAAGSGTLGVTPAGSPRGAPRRTFHLRDEPPSTKPAMRERHRTSSEVAQQPARTTPAAASLRPSAKRVTREQMCRELRVTP
jgi:hypothetical protein